MPAISRSHSPEKKSPLRSEDYKFWKTLSKTPRSYTFRRQEDKEDFKILVFGCHGVPGNPEKIVDLIAEIVEKDKPQFIIVTGDNFYPKGVDSPIDKNFKSLFYDKYLQHKSLRETPFFFLLGNHDCNYQRVVGLEPGKGEELAMNQVKHTCIKLNEKMEFNLDKIEYDPEKIKIIQQAELDKETLIKANFHWIMPAFATRIFIEDKNTELYLVNSNNYLRHYLRLYEIEKKLIDCTKEKSEIEKKTKAFEEEKSDCSERLIETEKHKKRLEEIKEEITLIMGKHEKESKMNQAIWLEKSVKASPLHRKALFQHHPIRTDGKRFTDSDDLNYLKPAEVKRLMEIFELKEPNHNIFLAKALEKQGILSEIDIVGNSHDHYTSLKNTRYNEQGVLINKNGICQMTVGGGGGPLDHMEVFKDIKRISLCEGYGCGLITFTGKEKTSDILIKLYNTKDQSWCFAHNTLQPRFNWDNIKEKKDQDFYLKVRHLILEGCYAYYKKYEACRKSKYKLWAYVAQKAGYTFGFDGIACGLRIVGLVNNPIPLSAKALVKAVLLEMHDSEQLANDINNQFSNAFKEDKILHLEELRFPQELSTPLGACRQEALADGWEIIKKEGQYSPVSESPRVI